MSAGDRAPPPDGEVHLWCADPDELSHADLSARARELLTTDEQDRIADLHFERDRRLHLATRVLLRAVLSRYQPVAPAAWRFSANAHGRPEIADPASSLRFNLSRTRGLVAIAVARDREIGVDIEQLDRPAPLEVAEQFFAPSELAALRALPPSEQPLRFFDYWTLKESYIKARGLGLSLPLDRFSIHFAPDRSPRIAIDPALADDAQSWQLAQRRPTPNHLLALCVRRHSPTDAAILLRWQSLAR